MRKCTLLCAIFGLLLSSGNALLAAKLDQEIEDLVQFLTSPQMLTPSKNGLLIPLSFYVGSVDDVARYFGDFICAPDNTCRVEDSLYSNPYAFIVSPFVILGRGLPPQEGTVAEWLQAQTQIERTNIKYGTDIYHAAIWQIALALAAENDYLSSTQAQTLVTNELDSISLPVNRAIDPLFKYGNQLVIGDPTKAFSFRLLATNYYNQDPFVGSRYQQLISWDYDPAILAANDPEGHSPDFFTYITTWSDWKPLTGENAWAQLIGPLQAEYIFNEGEISASSKALQNAMHSLYAFSAMQTATGALYYAPEGVRDSQGTLPSGLVVIEDNFSVLAGLQILKNILENTEQTADVIVALQNIDVLLNGGRTVNGWQTRGLLSFLYNGAYDTQNQVFYTQGSINIPFSFEDWAPDISPHLPTMGVNVNLWGISVLGVETVDNWFGQGTARNIWRIVRNQGGYFQNDSLWGLGFTLNNHTEIEPEDILSAENTASAINTLRALIDHYGRLEEDTSDLETDLTQMRTNLVNLRNDEYLASGFVEATPARFFIELPQELGRAYLYASRRSPLPFPFLWNANTLSSLSATAWVLVSKFDFNPFQYTGRLQGERYTIPVKVNILDRDTDPEGGALPRTVKVTYNRGNLGSITKLIISYNLDGSQVNWIVAGTTLQRMGVATLPIGAEGILISFYTDSGWAKACQVIPAARICKDNACTSTFTIAAIWSSNGQGRCRLE
jgi:hypothetical protein